MQIGNRKLKIKLIDTSLPMPSYQTSGSVAFDLYAREKTIIRPFKPTIIHLNVVIKIPEGYFLMLAIRSSIPLKKSLIIPNGIGVIDQDYCGEDDEIGLEVLNVLRDDVVVEKGERIAQAILVKVSKVERFKRVKVMGERTRGGFGSTD
jgi:dUTP pyrophosphatase